MKNIVILYLIFYIFLQTLNATKTSAHSIVYDDEVLIGFYGRPNTSSLGILGENNINNLVFKMKKKQKYYKKELEKDFNIKMAFHIIHSLATKDPGIRNDYLLNINEKIILKYIKRAKKENFEVILDVQLGVKTAYEAVKPLLKYLKYDNVHIEIDPEFKIPTHRRYPPEKYLGHIFAKDLNKAQKRISNYLKKYKLKNKRKVIVHMFHPRMLRNKHKVEIFKNIQLVYNIDGHGRNKMKIRIYNEIYSKDISEKIISGFKIFYRNDQKPLMTPKQILGMSQIGKTKILIKPYYINYH